MTFWMLGYHSYRLYSLDPGDEVGKIGMKELCNVKWTKCNEIKLCIIVV